MSGIISKIVAGAATFLAGYGTHAATETPPASLPNGNTQENGLNLTTIAGYAIVGGLVFYFGKKIIKG